ncbi:MAG TPA: GTPase Era [Bacteroidetes bacterium]|nr:GTPase Era [Bacteroidota bacterium]
MTHKAGFVNIIGNPNVGKSTLMNRLVGRKLAIVTSKAQTTRHRLLGIVNGEDFQIVYSDTPGMVSPKYKLQEFMVKTVRTALDDADIILYMTDVTENPDENHPMMDNIKTINVPVLLIINKTDLSDSASVEMLIQKWGGKLPEAEIFPVSAILGANLDKLLARILELLPENPPFYPKDQITDKPEKFFVEEIIREKILLFYRQEIPYSVEVAVESFKEEEKIIRISARIFVMRDSQKGILIGHQGKALKKVGTEARKEMEDFFNKKVFLELFVKVKKDWRDKERILRNLGYR